MLDLNDLPQDYPVGVGNGIGNALAQAGAICLESQKHQPGAALAVRGIADRSYQLNWTPLTGGQSALWQYNRATEMGAEAIAILLVKNETPYRVVEASVRGTGVDFWLGDDTDDVFQRKARLEISGIRRGSDALVSRRAAEKRNQTAQSDYSQTPAYIIVVEFGRPLAEIVVRNEIS